MYNNFVQKLRVHNKTLPDFLLAVMSTIIMRTNAAINKMLRVTEVMITGRLMLQSFPGVWEAAYTCTYICIFVDFIKLH